MRKSNPFKVSLDKPNVFIKRKKEITFITDNISNNKDVIIVSKNGIGKTTLIKLVFEKLESDKSYLTIFLDFKEIVNSTDPPKALYNYIFQNLYVKSEKHYTSKDIYENASLDEIKTKLTNSINQYSSKGIKVIIAFDNFKLDQKNEFIHYVNEIRSKTNLVYIFSTSFIKDNSIEGEVLSLGAISRKVYEKHIVKQFLKNKRSISKKSLDMLFNVCKGETLATQFICSRVWDCNSKKIKFDIMKANINNVLSDLEYSFAIAENLLSSYQLKLLKAIANEGKASKITSREFIDKYNLNAPSSVKTAINSLLEKEIIYRSKNLYEVQNKFFELYLSSNKH